MAALKRLNRRDFTAADLRQRLADDGFEEAAVAATVAELIDERLLDDERYAAQFVRSHAERGQGPRRIRQELKALGLADAEITAALEKAPDFHELARDLRRRRFGEEPPRDWQERVRQARFLQYRGFSNDHIATALGSSGSDDALPPEEIADEP